MSLIRYVFILTFTCICALGFSQTGPGGVGSSSNILTWLDASALGYSNGAEVSVWTDESGNGNDFGQGNSSSRPTFLTNQINSLPAVDFDGDDVLILPPSSDFDNQSDLTWFILAETDATSSAQNLLSTTYSGGGGASYKLNSLFRSGRHEELIRRDNGTYVSRTTNGVNSSPVIRSVAITGSSTDVMTRYVDGQLAHTASVSPFSAGIHAGTTMGRNSTNGNWFLDGRVAEMVFFNSALNVAQIHIVNNYLSSKYNVAISNDKFSFDGTHPNDLAGIGRESAGNEHTDARGASIVRINSASSLDDGDYLLWGHDNGSLTSTTSETGSLPANSIKLQREWVADTSNGNVGTVTISFDMTGINLGPDPADYRLLLDDDGNFNDATVIGSPTGTTTITFTGVDIYNGGPYFTIANTDNPDDCISIATNGWSTSPNTTWDCAILSNVAPDSTDNVTVDNGHTITVTGSESCNELVINAGGTLTISSGGALVVKDDMTINGTLNMVANSTLVFRGTSLTINQAISLASGSNFEFRGNVGLQQGVNNASGAIASFGNVNIANPNGVRFIGANNYALSGGLALTNGAFINTNTWTFESDASATGHIASIGSGTVAGGGSYILERFMENPINDSANWNSIANNGIISTDLEDLDNEVFISGIPGGDGFAQGEGGGFISVWYYDNASGQYVAPSNTSDAMPLGRGYEAWLGDTKTTWNAKAWDFRGSSINTTTTNLAAGSGWNLFGNPFPAFLDFASIETNYPQIQGSQFWYYDADSGQYNFRGPNAVMPPGQGFWLFMTGSATISIDPSQHFNSTVNNGELYKTRNGLPGLKLSVKGENTRHGSAIHVWEDDNAFSGFDDMDIPPLRVPAKQTVHMWMDLSGKESMVNYINGYEPRVEIPVKIESDVPGDYTVDFSGFSEFDAYQCMNLINEQTGEQIEVAAGAQYAFSIEDVQSPLDFTLVLSKDDYDDCLAPTASVEDQLRVYAHDKVVYTDFYLDRSMTATLTVYNMIGKQVFQDRRAVGYSRESIDLRHLTPGVYLVNIDLNGEIITEKVILGQ